MDAFGKIARLTLLIQSNRRITVRRIRDELGLSRSTAYRWLASIAPALPIRIDDGVVSLQAAEDVLKEEEKQTTF